MSYTAVDTTARQVTELLCEQTSLFVVDWMIQSLSDRAGSFSLCSSETNFTISKCKSLKCLLISFWSLFITYSQIMLFTRERMLFTGEWILRWVWRTEWRKGIEHALLNYMATKCIFRKMDSTLSVVRWMERRDRTRSFSRKSGSGTEYWLRPIPEISEHWHPNTEKHLWSMLVSTHTLTQLV